MRCRNWVKVVATFFVLVAAISAEAGDFGGSAAGNPVHQLSVGRLNIFQKYTEYIRFVLPEGRTFEVSDTAGFYWPPVYVDQGGYFYIGNKSIDSGSGSLVRVNSNERAIVLGSHYTVFPDDARNAIKIVRNRLECTVGVEMFGLHSSDGRPSDFLRGVIRFVDSDGPLVGFVTLGGDQAVDVHYKVVRISPGTCQMDVVDLGNPDLLVEIGWTPSGHWWITGSKEGTLIRSDDGKTWVASSLPEEITELVSAYVVDKKHVWLAANDSQSRSMDDPQIVYSGDGGKTWVPVTRSGSLISGVPKFWLEGQMRARGRSIAN